SLRAIARRWLDLDAEINSHDSGLEALVERGAPTMVEPHGIRAGTAAELLVLVGDDPERIRSEAAFAKLGGACPIPASSGKTTRHRLNRGGNRPATAAPHRGGVTRMRRHQAPRPRPTRGGNRQANAALPRVVVPRMRGHQPTLDYVQRRTREGKAKAEII